MADFDIINFRLLDCDIPRAPSYCHTFLNLFDLQESLCWFGWFQCSYKNFEYQRYGIMNFGKFFFFFSKFSRWNK